MLERLNATLRQRWNRTKMTWEESPSSGEDPSLSVILDSLLTTLERAVDDTLKGSSNLTGERPIEETRWIAVSTERETISQQTTNTQLAKEEHMTFSCSIRPIWKNQVWQRNLMLHEHREVREYLSRPEIVKEYGGAIGSWYPVERKATHTITGVEMDPNEQIGGTIDPNERIIAEIENGDGRKLVTTRCWTRMKRRVKIIPHEGNGTVRIRDPG